MAKRDNSKPMRPVVFKREIDALLMQDPESTAEEMTEAIAHFTKEVLDAGQMTWERIEECLDSISGQYASMSEASTSEAVGAIVDSLSEEENTDDDEDDEDDEDEEPVKKPKKPKKPVEEDEDDEDEEPVKKPKAGKKPVAKKNGKR